MDNKLEEDETLTDKLKWLPSAQWTNSPSSPSPIVKPKANMNKEEGDQQVSLNGIYAL